MCKEIFDNYREMSNELFWKRCVGSGSLSLFLSLCLAIWLFCFVGLFSKAVFDANFGFSRFVFLSLWGILSFVGACS